MAYTDKFFGGRVRKFSQRIETVLFDAYRRAEADHEARGLEEPHPFEMHLYSWPQEWPDWSCGFGGEARNQPCVDQTHVVVDDGARMVYVYHAARFVIALDCPGKAFWVAVRKHELPGAQDEKAWAKLAKQD